MSFWEITRRDSSGEVVLAVTLFLWITIVIVTGLVKVWKHARRSIELHQNPAYILYSDSRCLNTWGPLYVQYNATVYYFMFPMFAYTLIKCLFIALGQGNGVLQAIAIMVLELAVLLAVSIMRPYMDKKTNGLHIAIAAVNFTNAILLLFFTGILGVPVSYTLLFSDSHSQYPDARNRHPRRSVLHSQRRVCDRHPRSCPLGNPLRRLCEESGNAIPTHAGRQELLCQEPRQVYHRA
jgi:hypothetical protein